VNAIHEPNQDEIDAALEREIETARLAMVRADAAGDKDGAREFKEAMYALLGQRSPQQIARLEAKLPKKWGTT
jgi:hypothetical protein